MGFYKVFISHDCMLSLTFITIEITLLNSSPFLIAYIKQTKSPLLKHDNDCALLQYAPDCVQNKIATTSKNYNRTHEFQVPWER